MKDSASRGAPEDLRGVPVAILGCGAVGGAFAVDLSLAGADLRLWSRTHTRAEGLSKRLRGAKVGATALEAVGRAKLVLLCVADEALAALAGELAPGVALVDSAPVWIHTNGFHGLSVLAPLSARGFPVGKIHPLTAVPAGGLPGRMRGTWFATAGTPPALGWIERIVRAVEGSELRLGDPEPDSRRLHAAATLLSGGLVALFDAAFAVARGPGLSEEPLGDALRSLLRATAGNLESFEPKDALTGPVVRGSVDLVRGHLEVLERADPALARLYQDLGSRMLALAVLRGSVERERVLELEALFARGAHERG